MNQYYTACNHQFLLNRTQVWGILNTTSDSFSDGGSFLAPTDAIAHGKKMISQGADVLDIGGESTRPNFQPVSISEELSRVLPVIGELAPLIPISVDTTKYDVAKEALDCGAVVLNDIWGLSKEPRLATLAANCHAGMVLMHNQDGTVYGDLLADMRSFFKKSLVVALSAGVDPSAITLDVGIGFGKTRAQNCFILNHLDTFLDLGYPLFLGVSRKSIIGLTLNLPVTERLEGTIASNCLGIAKGASILRVHDVLETKRAAAMCDAILQTTILE